MNRSGKVLARARRARGWASGFILLGWGLLAGAVVLALRLAAGLPALEWTGVVLLGLYIGFFARSALWVWRRSARRRSKGRPQASALPSIGLLVLVPDDADVVAQTIRRMEYLDYPQQRLQVLLIVDGSERRMVQARARALSEQLVPMARSPDRRPTLPADHQGLMHWLQRLFDEPNDPLIQPLYEAMARRRPSRRQLRSAARSSLATYSSDQESKVGDHLATVLRQHGQSLQAFRLLAARPAHPGLAAMTLADLYRAISLRPSSTPSPTQSGLSPSGRADGDPMAVRAVQATPALAHMSIVVVPPCYGDSCRGGEEACPGPARCPGSGRVDQSSAGRSLNWALHRFSQMDVIGIYDAGCRPQRDVLQQVARQWQQYGVDQRSAFLTRGPVLPVQNLYRLGPLARVAALDQAVIRDVYYPVWQAAFPLPGDTNIFFAPQLVAAVGGLAERTASGNPDLALRIWEKMGIAPSFLPAAASEQAPPTVRATMRQRERWAFGYVDGLAALRRGRRWATLGLMVLEGPVQWVISVGLFVVGISGLILIATGLLPSAGGLSLLAEGVVLINLPFALFIPSRLVRDQPWIDLRLQPRGLTAWIGEAGRVLAHAPFLLFMTWPMVIALGTYDSAERRSASQPQGQRR